jgi:GDSL-like Lipase/Acylhydrolase family
VAFLSAHVDDHVLVSIDLGFNDVRDCLRPGALGAGASCLAPRLAAVRTQLTAILAALRAAAGPHVAFVGLNHFDPFVAAPARHLRDAQRVGPGVGAVDALNEVLADVYGAAGVPVAQVTRAFDQGDTAPASYPGLGVVPAEVARVCELTWMCQRAPRGPNIHPNDAGYLQIAAAVLAALPAGWASA